MNAIDVAQYLLYRANLDGEVITNLKMQKLLYYAHAWYMVNFDKPLFDDTIGAWDYGPAIYDIYRRYKKFGYSPIKYKHTGKEVEIFDKRQLEYLDQFYGKFIKYSAHTLARATHNDDPWKNARENGEEFIDNEVIKEYYKKQLKTKTKEA